MENKINEETEEALMEWLEEEGRTIGDIMSDEGGKYVLKEVFNESEFGPDYQITHGYDKVYLPDQFQELVI